MTLLPESLRLQTGHQRSGDFTEFNGHEVFNGQQHIDFHNPHGVDIFNMYPRETQRAVELLRSGTVQVVIPARNELQFGYYPHVLQHMISLTGPENILVVDADSWDGTGDYAREHGIETIVQSEVEAGYDMQRITEDFGIETPLRAGKGRTMLAASIYQIMVQDRLREAKGLPPMPAFNLFSDADITNPTEFNHATWLAWASTEYPPDQLGEMRAAQHDRNNQAVMNSMAILQNTNPLMRHYYDRVSELVWPLTGQFMKAPAIMRQVPNVIGYGTEMLANLGSCDVADKLGLRRAQIEIPHRCRDGANSTEKEVAMMTGISALLMVVNDELFRHGIRLDAMTAEDYRRVNKKLSETEQQFTISSIREGTYGPNTRQGIVLDRFLPPAQYLVDNGYVDPKVMDEIYSRQQKAR